MSNFWIGYLTGVLSGFTVAAILTYCTRFFQQRGNVSQWESIQRFLSEPSLIRAVTGSASIMGHVNNTPWTVRVQAYIEVPLTEDADRVYRLAELEWRPNEGAIWELTKELTDILRNPQARVFVDVSYEPVHKNTGKVHESRIGDRVRVRRLEFLIQGR